MKRIFLMTVLIFSVSVTAHSAMKKKVTLKGKVGNMSKRHIVVKTDGGKVKVPRHYFEGKNPRTGHHVSVEVDIVKVVRYNNLLEQKQANNR